MANPAKAMDDLRTTLDERVDDIISTHEGDARDAIKTLMMALDARTASISYGYVRGRAPGDKV